VLRTSPRALAADTALLVAEIFAADPSIVAVIGHANSAASLAASQIYNRSGLVQIAPTSTSTAYGRAGPYSFRMVPGDDMQGSFLVDAMRDAWPEAGRIALLYVNDDYGRSFYREVRSRLDSVVFEGMYSEQGDTVRLQELGARLAEAQPDVVIWLGRPLALGVVLEALRSRSVHPHVLCGDACDTALLHGDAAGAYMGVRFVRFTDPKSSAPAMTAFAQRYQELTGEPATSEALLTHDALVAVQAALDGGARTREQVRRYLHSLGRERPALEGLAGPITFDEAGSVVRPYLLAEVAEAGVYAVTGTRH
jgi:branched-chain amino acid transport system substrate-binding protein